MPKASAVSSAPLSCLFAINKPSGIVAMRLLDRLQPLFQSSSLFKDQDGNTAQKQHEKNQRGRKSKWKETRVKMGQGGTLDPLADGVLGFVPLQNFVMKPVG